MATWTLIFLFGLFAATNKPNDIGGPSGCGCIKYTRPPIEELIIGHFDKCKDKKCLRIKPGADKYKIDPKVYELAFLIQNKLEGFIRFTSFSDQYHKDVYGPSNKHNQGLALDFTVEQLWQSSEEIAKARAQLKQILTQEKYHVKVQFLNKDSCSRCTGPHIHIHFLD